MQRERDEPVVIGVGQFTLGLRPDELVWIELRRVARKAVHQNPGMSLEKGPDVPAPMNCPAIPQQGERSTVSPPALKSGWSKTSKTSFGYSPSMSRSTFRRAQDRTRIPIAPRRGDGGLVQLVLSAMRGARRIKTYSFGGGIERGGEAG